MLAKYQERLRHEHGWEVPLRCHWCGADSVPNYLGWTPSQIINWADKPTIYANLECPKCGHDVKETAGEKLVELFADKKTDPQFKRVAALFHHHTDRAIGPASDLASGLGRRIDIVSRPAHATPHRLVPSPVCMACASDAQLAKPAYKFMGMLGRSYCYRCSNCAAAEVEGLGRAAGAVGIRLTGERYRSECDSVLLTLSH